MFIIERESGVLQFFIQEVKLTVWSITERRKFIHSKLVTAADRIQFTLTCAG